jgi:hypothetical protein
MLPFCWLNMGSLYFTLTTTRTHSTNVSFAFNKTTIFYLVSSTSSTPLDILIPWVATSCSTI